MVLGPVGYGKNRGGDYLFEEKMTQLLKQILESKRRERQRLARLSFSEKIEILEKLRERNRLIASSPLGAKHRKAAR